MLRDIIVDPYFPDCPIRNILSRISDRWSMLVLRQAYAEIPPRVEYSITERGKSLMPHINSLIEWALANLADILNDRKKYSSNNKH